MPQPHIAARSGTDRSLRAVAHGGLFLGGLVLVGLGLLATSCHVRQKATAREHEGVVGGFDVQAISADAPEAAAPGQMVHFTGLAQGVQPLVDTELGFSVLALALERRVSMYQWVESCGGQSDPPELGPRNRPWRPGERLGVWDRCHYTQHWRPTPEKTKEKYSLVYGNPAFPVEPDTKRFELWGWRVGAIKITNGRPPEIPSDTLTQLYPTSEQVRLLPPALRARARIQGDLIYVGDPQKPKVGDLKIQYRYRREMPVSVVGLRDAWGGVSPRPLPDGSTFLQVRAGTYSAGEMVSARRSAARDAWQNHAMLATFFLLGTLMLFWPLRAVGRSIPGPPLITGAGVLLFVPLGAVALQAGTLACAWWEPARTQALLAAGAAGAAAGLLVMLSALRYLLFARGTSS